MASGGRGGDEYTYPSFDGYQPPLKLLGGSLWALALVSILGLWVLTDFEVSPATTVGLAAVARAFVGVVVFAAAFPIVFHLRRTARRA
ncbi:hypothetical protein [Halorubrum sp. SD626R]|jgi:hypothetical protein|uniref:hypothetical protein n=1 Tax=Halorubrum sp. SD626R TaxID=1419722 RepID=UPI000AAD52DB|nr:hypothetical protein [Halorubrum sp. SD626R]TKX80218.1 hypothetical protein EXE53_11600 [Halorubrum sp. SD626R]